MSPRIQQALSDTFLSDTMEMAGNATAKSSWVGISTTAYYLKLERPVFQIDVRFVQEYWWDLNLEIWQLEKNHLT